MARRAYLGLGSNLGDRSARLRSAVAGLEGTPDIRVAGCSDVYETDPVGGPEQGAFYNLVVAVDTDLAPRSLLGVCQRLEAEAERIREERWGPRTLDVDVLWIDGYESDDPVLMVPHPRMWERRFVLAPLADLAPDVVPAGWEDEVTGEVRRLGPLR